MMKDNKTGKHLPSIIQENQKKQTISDCWNIIVQYQIHLLQIDILRIFQVKFYGLGCFCNWYKSAIVFYVSCSFQQLLNFT